MPLGHNFNTTLVKVHQIDVTITWVEPNNFNTTLVKVHRSGALHSPLVKVISIQLLLRFIPSVDIIDEDVIPFQYNSC